MPKKLSEKEILIKIRTQLEADKTVKNTYAFKQIQEKYKSFENYVSEYVKKVGELNNVDLLRSHYLEAELRASQRRYRERVKELKKEKEEAETNYKVQKKINKEKEKQLMIDRTNGALLGARLSMLFTSWTVSRHIGNLLDDWFKTYNKINQGQTEYQNNINKASAALAFLKFVIVDTFSRSTLVQKFTDLFVKMANAVSEFVAAHPTITLSLLFGGLAIKTLADLTTLAVQFAMLSTALLGLAKLKGTSIAAAVAITADAPTWLISLLSLTGKISLALVISAISFELGKSLASYLIEKMDDDVAAAFAYFLTKAYIRLRDFVSWAIPSIFKIMKTTNPFLNSLLSIFDVDISKISEKIKTSMDNLFKSQLGQGYGPEEFLKKLKESTQSVKEEVTNTDEMTKTTWFDFLTSSIVTAKQKVSELKEELNSLKTDYSNVNISIKIDSYSPHGG